MCDRARRFGKSIGAKMLYAYYDLWSASEELFADLHIHRYSSFKSHFRRYPVLYIDMTDFVTRFDSGNVVQHIQSDVIAELKEIFPDVPYHEDSDLADVLHTIVSSQPLLGKFIMIIDEWDAILRGYKDGGNVAEQYINLLRGLFKSTNAMSTFADVYMTGILPIKKYNTQSALNNFHEYSAVQPCPMAEYFGFTSKEVCTLCANHDMDYDMLTEWYDGYQIGANREILTLRLL